MKTAYATVKGFEVMRARRKGQAGLFSFEGGIIGEARLVECAFSMGPWRWYGTVWPAQSHKTNHFSPRPPTPLCQICNRAVETQ